MTTISITVKLSIPFQFNLPFTPCVLISKHLSNPAFSCDWCASVNGLSAEQSQLALWLVLGNRAELLCGRHSDGNE